MKKKRKQYFGLILVVFVILVAQEITAERYFIVRNMRPEISLVQPGGRIVMMDRRRFFPSPSDMERRKMRPMPPRLDESVIFGIPQMFLFRTIAGILFTVFLMMLLGGFIRLAFSYFTAQNEKKILENANLTAENNLLKSQINPHFLFNTLNSIYSQALHKSSSTEKSILKLSEILRYMVYETGAEKILLDKDIYYITSFIELQRMRLPESVVIDYQVKGDIDNVYISPLILIAFIENAFKYGVSFIHGYGIHIHIEVKDKLLKLLVENPIVKQDAQSGHNGIGQKNAIRRLELLYPGRYKLTIDDRGQIYSVTLKIDLQS